MSLGHLINCFEINAIKTPFAQMMELSLSEGYSSRKEQSQDLNPRLITANARALNLSASYALSCSSVIIHLCVCLCTGRRVLVALSLKWVLP